LFHGIDQLVEEIRGNYLSFDMMVQRYVKPRGAHPSLLRYILKDNNVVYRAIKIQSKEAFDKESSLF